MTVGMRTVVTALAIFLLLVEPAAAQDKCAPLPMDVSAPTCVDDPPRGAVYLNGGLNGNYTAKCYNPGLKCADTTAVSYLNPGCKCTSPDVQLNVACDDSNSPQYVVCGQTTTCPAVYTSPTCAEGSTPAIFGNDRIDTWRWKCELRDSSSDCSNTRVVGFYSAEKCGKQCPGQLQQLPTSGCRDDAGQELLVCGQMTSKECSTPLYQGADCQDGPPALFTSTTAGFQCGTSDRNLDCSNAEVAEFYPATCTCPPGLQLIPGGCDDGNNKLIMCGKANFRATPPTDPPAPAPPAPAPSKSTTPVNSSGVGATLTGDPHLVNMAGHAWEFQGLSGAVFNMYSAQDIQLNVRLVAFGDDPTQTFMQALGLKLGNGAALQVSVDDHCQDRAVPPLVLLDGVALHQGNQRSVNTRWGRIAVEQRTANISDEQVLTTIVEVPGLLLNILKAPGACHMDLNIRVTDAGDAAAVEGVLGQSLRCALAAQPTPCPFKGDEMSYMVSGLFEDDFQFNRFRPTLKKPYSFGKGRLRSLRSSTAIESTDSAVDLGVSQHHGRLLLSATPSLFTHVDSTS